LEKAGEPRKGGHVKRRKAEEESSSGGGNGGMLHSRSLRTENCHKKRKVDQHGNKARVKGQKDLKGLT